MNQVRVAWTGAPGMPGVSTFYNEGSVAPFLAKLRTFFDAMKSFVPNTVTFSVPGTGNVVDSVTGQVTATWAATAPAPVLGTGSGTYSAPVGIVFNWKTGLFVAGRQLRGKTFLVPIVSGATDSSGRLAAANQPIAVTAGNNLCGGTDGMVVYSPTHRVNGVALSCTVPTALAVLRSRRD